MSQNIYQQRVQRFKELMEKNRIDAVMIRNIYSFTYFTGIPWWQPAVLIPQREPPIIFAFEDEVEELKERTWIDKILGYRKVEDLMRAVTSNIRRLKVETLGFDIDIDASALLFEQFRNLNPGKKIVNVHSLIMKLRMIKDSTEIELIHSEKTRRRVNSGLRQRWKAQNPRAPNEQRDQKRRLGDDRHHASVQRLLF
jgi:Xaa-Pro aminopeptidase